MKTRNTTRLRLSLAVALCVFGSGVTQPANAQLTLPDQPLFVNLSAPQASIMLGLDNSNSMRIGLIRLSSVANYLTSVIPEQGTDPTDYILNGTESYLELVRKLSTSCLGANLLAYNPQVSYPPWPGFASRTMTDAQNSDPGYDNTPFDISNNIIVDWGDDGDGMFNLPSTAWNTSADDLNGNEMIDPSSEHVTYDPANGIIAECAFPPTRTSDGAGAVLLEGIGQVAERQIFINRAIAAGRIRLVGDTARVTNEERNNYANWYTYHRIPLLLLKNEVLKLVRGSEERMGVIPMRNIYDFFEYRGANPSNPRNQYYPPPANSDDFAISLKNMREPDQKEAVENAVKNLRVEVIGANDTPLRKLLQRIGLYFDYSVNTISQPSAPENAEIVSIGHDFWEGSNTRIRNAYLPESEGGSCQRNFALIFTDGLTEETVEVGFALNQHADLVFNDLVRLDADSNDDTDYDEIPHKDTDPRSDASNRDTRTLADIAMHFYERDLHPFEDNVPTSEYVDPSNNITYTSGAEHQHLVTYIVGFGGASEAAIDSSLDPLTLPGDHSTASPTWPVPQTLVEGPYNPHPLVNPITPERRRALIHDLQHAAFNSRGLFLSAEDAPSLAAALQLIIDQIRTRSGLSGSAPAQNSSSLRGDSRIFQARFNSGDWSGELTASSLTQQGELGQEVWQATIPDANNRNIYTGIWMGIDLEGARFENDSIMLGLSFTLPSSSIASIPPGTTPQDIIQYIAGVQDREGTGANDFRQRNTLLGDIVSSSPISVGYVDYNYGRLPGSEGTSYPAFLAQKRGLFPGSDTVVYVGANDGMLHAFQDNTGLTAGRELFAYIPNALWTAPSADKSNIVDLLDRGYDHKFYVNGEQSVGDVYVCDNNGNNCDWKSILVGSYGEGAKGIYALDVTNPFNFVAANVLWEYEPDNAPNATTRRHAQSVGYIKHAPVFARLNNGDWGVIFGGYSDDASGPALFILDAATGYEIAVLPSNSGNPGDGYAQPLVIDKDGDLIADTVYAGTLRSGLYKFDISSENISGDLNDPNDPNDDDPPWGSVYSGAFFEPKDPAGNIQPIVTQPAIAVNPEGGFNLIVGTGKYLEATDLDAPYQVQSLYSIRDDDLDNDPASRVLNPRSPPPNKILEEQKFLREIDFFTQNNEPRTARISSTNTIDYSASPPIKGWYLDLLTPERTDSDNIITPARTESDGERVVSRPMVRGENAIFTLFTPIPSYCGEGRNNSFFFEVDALSGARLENAVFDVDGDGVIGDEDDFFGTPANPIHVSGYSIPGTLSSPAVISLGGGQEVKVSLGIGGETTTVRESAATAITGRQSWRQLR